MSTASSQPKSGLLIFILTLGVFGLLNTEMGVIGMLPLIAETFDVTVPQAGWTVTIFALVVAISGPIMPMLFSRFNRKSVMLLALGVFIIGNIVSMLTTSFTTLLVARAIPAFFHPVYVSMAFTIAASSVAKQDAPKAVARVFIGVSAGMVLGVPIASFIASQVSYSMAMLFFAVVNIAVFVATLFIMPSMPAQASLPYGAQLSVLKKPLLWSAIAAVVFTNAGVFGFFSYLSDYLNTVTQISFTLISIILFIYGLANIIGNMLAGKLLVINADRTIKSTPMALGVVLIALFFMGDQWIAMTATVLLFGILTGLSSNNSQFMIANAAREAPEFANGLFLTASNIGTATGTAFCGLFISGMGTRYAILGALICLVGATVSIFIASHLQTTKTQNNLAQSAL